MKGKTVTEELDELEQLTLRATELEKKIGTADKRLTAARRVRNGAQAAYNDLWIGGADHQEVGEAWNAYEKANANVAVANNEYERLDGERGYLKVAFGEAQARAHRRRLGEAYPAIGGILTEAGFSNVCQHVWRDPRGAFVGSQDFNARVGSDDPRAVEALRLHLQMVARSAELMISTLQRLPGSAPAGTQSSVLSDSQALDMLDLAAAMAKPYNGR